jgi:hypothetical protein
MIVVCQGLLFIEDTWSHSHTPFSVVLLWTSVQRDTESATWPHTTLTTDIHAPHGIRIDITSKREATDQRLKQHAHWYRPLIWINHFKTKSLQISPLLSPEVKMSSQQSDLNTSSDFFPSKYEHFPHSLTVFAKQESQHVL